MWYKIGKKSGVLISREEPDPLLHALELINSIFNNIKMLQSVTIRVIITFINLSL